MDLQFPNGQLTYVAGEGLSTSAFLPFLGGLLQAQGQYPGEMRFSYSCKVSCSLVLCIRKHFNFVVLYFLTWSWGCRINGEHALHQWYSGLKDRLLWDLNKL